MGVNIKKDFVQEAFSEDGLLSKHFEGYKVRPQQVELAEEIQSAVKEGKPLLGEAPTGVGKSLAALIPAFETIIKNDSPVVVVTSSIILQEQYFHKDIPLLEKIFDYDTGAVLIKGRNNYLCKQKHAEFKAGNFTQGTNRYQKEMEDVMNWANETKTGDMSELDFVPPYPVWSQFAAIDSNECARKDCPLYNQCHYYNQRRSLMSSKLVICNYHYFFNAIKNVGMLPDGVEVVIMDEGHEIAGIARDFQERTYNYMSIKKILSEFGKRYKAAERSGMFPGLFGTVEAFQLDMAQQSLTEMASELTRYFHENKPTNRESWTLSPEEREKMQSLSDGHFKYLKTSIDEISAHLAQHGLDQEQRMYWDELYEEDEVQWQVAQENLLDALKERELFLAEFFLREEDQGADMFFDEDDDELQLEMEDED